MIVKICGIKTLADARAAVAAGADMLGFNFYPASPRYLDPAACAALIAALRDELIRVPILVGVFVNMPPADVSALLDSCGLDLAQLHGDEPPEVLAALGIRAFKAIRPRAAGEADAQLQAYCRRWPAAPDILLDASAPGLYGGSGKTADWSVAASLARRARLLLAGGLHPGNVAEAIAAVRPWGVDVASGVESAPAVKDPAKMAEFVRKAKGN